MNECRGKALPLPVDGGGFEFTLLIPEGMRDNVQRHSASKLAPELGASGLVTRA